MRAPPARSELLLTEADIYGLSPLPSAYEPRDNELGVTFEILLYGTSGRYVPLAKKFRERAATALTQSRAAKAIEAGAGTRTVGPVERVFDRRPDRDHHVR